MQGYVGLCRAMQGYAGLYRSMQGYTGLYRFIWVTAHAFTEDTQIYFSFKPDSHYSQDREGHVIEKCIADIRAWMVTHHLMISDSELEFLIIRSRGQLSKININSITVGDSSIEPVNKKKKNKKNNYLTWPLPKRGFSGPMETNDETNNANEHNMVKNPNWQEADQLAIYKRGRGVELGSTKWMLKIWDLGVLEIWDLGSMWIFTLKNILTITRKKAKRPVFALRRGRIMAAVK